MIHLDRNHHPSPISMHSSPNLILPTTHTDQLKLLSRSPLTRDDKLVHQEHQERSSNTSVGTDATHLPAPPPSDAASVDETVKSHSSAPPSPRAETPGHRSSSLSPVPESASPKPTQSTSSPAEETISVEDHATEAESSRHSTPLSELSPPPDQEESFEDDKKDDIDLAEVHDEVAGGDDPDDTKDASEIKEEKKEDLSMESISGGQKLQSALSPRSLSATSTLISPRPLAESDGKSASSPDRTSAATTTRAFPSKSPVKSPASEFALPQDPRAGSRQPSVPNSSSSGTPAPSMDKAVRLLELNAELLKVCMEFQTQHVPMNDSRFQQYATRLQANLTWLANAVDSNRQGNPSNPTLPIMEPPISVDFVSMERIHQLYADLPSMFAKEIRRQQMGIAHRVPPFIPSFPSNVSLKRDRSDDIEASIANKRRDTGESKSPPMRPPATPPPPSIITPPSAAFPMSTNDPSGHMNMSPIQSMSMPSIAPPILPQGMPEAQLAASARERTRQIQIQQARQQQHQQQQQQNARQMSPPSAQGSAQIPSQGQMSNAGSPAILNNLNPNALGPHAAQNLQILQNASHPFTQYMNHSVPGFTTLPVQEQLRRMQIVQSAVQQKQQQNQVSGQQRVPIPGMSQQQPMQSMQNSGMRGTQYPGQSGGVTSPTSSQAQQQQSPQNGAFPFTQNHLNPGANVANPQMMGMRGMNINNATPHQQRQLLLLQQQQQQQQHMRTTSGNTNPGMMTPEQVAMAQERFRQEQQRISQAASPTNANSPPMSASGNDGNMFPVLRSNAALPGISRSTLSPSDGAPTPLSPQMPRGSMPDMRRMANPNMGGGMGGGMDGQMMGGQMPGFNQQMANWQSKQQQSMPMGHLQPPNYGVQPFVAGGNSYGGAVPNQTWQSQYPLASSPNSGGYQQLEQTRQSSSTPAPQQLQIHSSLNSPPAQHTSPSDLEIFTWNQ